MLVKLSQDGNISLNEYQQILKEIEHYRQIKQQIRQKTKRVTDAITQEQRQQILDEGKKQGKEDFFKANRKYFQYPGCQCHIDYELPPKYDDS